MCTLELGNSVMLTLNSAPKVKLLNKSPLYYERGVQPLLPIDCVAALQSAGIRDQDLAPVQVLDRVQFLHDLHMRVRDQIIEANLKITYYANQKRVFAADVHPKYRVNWIYKTIAIYKTSFLCLN